MSYYADISGSITLRDDIDTEKAFNEITSLFSQEFSGLDIDWGYCPPGYNNDKGKVIVLNGNYSYDEDTMINIYEKIIPYVFDAELDFKGEDDTFWKDTFNRNEGIWEQQSGEIVYGEPSRFAGHSKDIDEEIEL